jgi:hypothetical protein
MRTLFATLALGLLLGGVAHAGNYVVVCTAPCVADDGTTQPAGTVLNRITWDGHAPLGLPAGLAVQPDTGQARYDPTKPNTVISASDFIARFTIPEQVAIATAAQTNASIGVWQTKLAAATTVDLTDPAVKAALDELVTAGLLTQARETAILAP